MNTQWMIMNGTMEQMEREQQGRAVLCFGRAYRDVRAGFFFLTSSRITSHLPGKQKCGMIVAF